MSAELLSSVSSGVRYGWATPGRSETFPRAAPVQALDRCHAERWTRDVHRGAGFLLGPLRIFVSLYCNPPSLSCNPVTEQYPYSTTLAPARCSARMVWGSWWAVAVFFLPDTALTEWFFFPLLLSEYFKRRRWKWTPYLHSTRKARLMECFWCGCPSGRFFDLCWALLKLGGSLSSPDEGPSSRGTESGQKTSSRKSPVIANAFHFTTMESTVCLETFETLELVELTDILVPSFPWPNFILASTVWSHFRTCSRCSISGVGFGIFFLNFNLHLQQSGSPSVTTPWPSALNTWNHLWSRTNEGKNEREQESVMNSAKSVPLFYSAEVVVQLLWSTLNFFIYIPDLYLEHWAGIHIGQDTSSSRDTSHIRSHLATGCEFPLGLMNSTRPSVSLAARFQADVMLIVTLSWGFCFSVSDTRFFPV